ncbi:Panacea domain-containing protein [Candidatus Poriferisocius sp.]|uniref:Panacea domain-containing protein n=1 Tax=Candidatus Poriferisocius sp. TaxID=3101276 RepID=UPI003B02734B
MSSSTNAGSSAFAIAKELYNRIPRLSKLNLHKLLFFIQAEHLAWYGNPAFTESIEAWENGPVVAEVWHDRPSRGARSRSIPQDLDNVMRSVVARFRGTRSNDLVALVHEEGPWVEATAGGTVIANQIITYEAMREYAQQLPKELEPLREALKDHPRDRPFVADPR